LKILLAMMRLLSIDVTNQRFQIRRPNRERTIPSLPRELRQVRRLSLKPLGRGRLKLFHQIRNICRARQTNGEMNVIRDSTHTKSLAFGVAGNGSKIGIECWTHRKVKNWATVLCAEDHMDQNKRERLRHRVDYRSSFRPSYSIANRTWGFTPCWYSRAPLALSSATMAICVFCLLLPSVAIAQPPHQLRIRIINAKNNQPVPDERLNVALRIDQIGSVAMATDKNGIILVDTGNATTIRILSNMYADCRPRAELYTDYSIATIRHTGITTGNLCSSASPPPRPGVLLLFEIPKTYIPGFGQPPASNLPHSDENPHATPNQPQ
jgi:hypothetical protein